MHSPPADGIDRAYDIDVRPTLDVAVFEKRLASATAAGLHSILLAMSCTPCQAPLPLSKGAGVYTVNLTLSRRTNNTLIAGTEESNS